MILEYGKFDICPKKYERCLHIGNVKFDGLDINGLSFARNAHVGDVLFEDNENISNVEFTRNANITTVRFLFCKNISNISFTRNAHIKEVIFIGCENVSNISFARNAHVGDVLFEKCENVSGINGVIPKYKDCENVDQSSFNNKDEGTYNTYTQSSSVCINNVSTGGSINIGGSNKGWRTVLTGKVSNVNIGGEVYKNLPNLYIDYEGNKFTEINGEYILLDNHQPPTDKFKDTDKGDHFGQISF